jgi:hypothetical protein
VSYVFLLAVIGPIATRFAEPMADRILGPSAARTPETEEIA